MSLPGLPHTTTDMGETTDSEESIPQLPVDTFDTIASHLERPSDLLSLALACKGLSEIVLTRHINYRDVALVQLDAKDEMIWNNLLSHPDRTANIRRLELRLRGCCPGMDGRIFIPSFTRIITLMRKVAYLKVVEPPDSTNILVHSWELCWRELQSHDCLVTLEVAIGQMMLSSKTLGFLQVGGDDDGVVIYSSKETISAQEPEERIY